MDNDVTYLLIIFGLFASAFGLVKICDLIIGDEDAGEEQGTDPAGADTTGGSRQDEAIPGSGPLGGGLGEVAA